MLLNDDVKGQVKEQLAALNKPVRMVYFTQEIECRFCSETRQLLEEVAELSDKVILETHVFEKESEAAERYGVDKIPATVITTADDGPEAADRGIRFYGIPSGYEFGSLLYALKLLSIGDHELLDETTQVLNGLKEPVHLQVFVTPTCPYCPMAVTMAHRMAYASENVQADMVEATEFPELSNRYGVMGVPRTVINEDTFQEGAAPEETLLEKIREAIG